LNRGTRRPGDQPRWLTSGTSTRASVPGSDHRVEWGSRGLGGWLVEDSGDTCRVAGDAYGVRYSWRFGGLGLKTIGWTGLRVCASKPRRRFRGGTDGTWRHRGVCVEAKLSQEGHGGHRMKITSGWTITPSGYVVQLKTSKGKTRIV
jgi:hypothetical protein